ncbi:MAG: orotate phosphoribosyltransferase [Sulfolobales archaeon]
MLEKLILSMYEVGIVKFGDFLLASGKRSPYYFDFRILPSFPELYLNVIKFWLQKLGESGVRFDGVVGIASAGIVHAAVLGYLTKKPIGYVRAERKDHGTGRLVEGSLKGLKVLVVDDVATTGGTLVRAYGLLREEGVDVSAFSVILDREEGAEDAITRLGVPMISLVRTSQIFAVLRKFEVISQDTYELVLNYLRGSR